MRETFRKYLLESSIKSFPISHPLHTPTKLTVSLTRYCNRKSWFQILRLVHPTIYQTHRFPSDGYFFTGLIVWTARREELFTCTPVHRLRSPSSSPNLEALPGRKEGSLLRELEDPHSSTQSGSQIPPSEAETTRRYDRPSSIEKEVEPLRFSSFSLVRLSLNNKANNVLRRIFKGLSTSFLLLSFLFNFLAVPIHR